MLTSYTGDISQYYIPTSSTNPITSNVASTYASSTYLPQLQLNSEDKSKEVTENMRETFKKKAYAINESTLRARSKKYNIPDEDPETKTAFRVYDEKIHIGIYEEGKLFRIADILPSIEDVQIYDQKVIVVSFSDGTKETARVDAENDYFDIEQGISICIAKKLLSDKTDGNGTSVYNKLIKYALDTERKNRRAEARACTQKREQEDRVRRRRLKARKKKEERANARREEQINIQAEAYVRAMKKLEEEQ